MRVSASGLFVVASMLAGGLPATAQGTLDRPLPAPVPYEMDSGWVANPTGSARVVHRAEIDLPGADWIRLYFGDVALEAGSFLRLTSRADGQVQELGAEALARWNNSSGYFNGDLLDVELVAGAGTVRNRVVVEQVAWDDFVPTGSGCDPGCCGVDDRVPSNEDWAARLLPAGCTASIYNSNSCAVSAGHCVGGGMVLEFKVPPSSPNCALNHPPIAEQFPVTQFSFTNGGIGNDWSALVVGTNNLGQTPFQRYGVFRPIASTPPQVGQPATVWGYGVDTPCTATQTQQTSSGPIAQVTATALRFTIDVTFGNSGSGVLRDGQEIVGIVTHCCCPNQGTRVDHPAFVAAREALCPTSAPQTAELLSANVIVGVPISGGLTQLLNSDNSHFVVDSVTQGTRNNTITEILALSPFVTVSNLNLTVEYGPADATPVFQAVHLFNHDTGAWVNVSYGIVSQTGDTLVNLQGIANSNAYVSNTGQVRIRVAQTARLAQTPTGFTTLIDRVTLTVEP